MERTSSGITVGPGGVLYVVVTGLILGAALYTQANLLFWAFGLMVGGLMMSVAWALLSLRKLEVERIAPSSGVVGEALVLRYALRNRSRLPQFSLVLTETWGPGDGGWRKTGPIAERPRRLKGLPTGWVLHVGPRQPSQAETVCWPLLRGDLRLQRLVVSSSFPFGIIRRRVVYEQSTAVLIYPQLYRLPKSVVHRAVQTDAGTGRQNDRGGGREEFLGLRGYRSGDPIRRIDWKRTARTGRLVSREYSLPMPPRAMILLDLSRPFTLDGLPPTHGDAATAEQRRNQEERAISLAASLICDAYRHGYRVGLAVNGPPSPLLPPHHSLPHRVRLLETLARLDLDSYDHAIDPVVTRPTVIVVPGRGQQAKANRDTRRAMVIGAVDMPDWVEEADAQALLDPLGEAGTAGLGGGVDGPVAGGRLAG